MRPRRALGLTGQTPAGPPSQRITHPACALRRTYGRESLPDSPKSRIPRRLKRGRRHPLPEIGSEDDGQGSSAEVQCKLDGNARRDDMGCTADGENDALQRASFRSARPPPSQTPTGSAFQRGWVGGRSRTQF
jgi:hypothetical protein